MNKCIFLDRDGVLNRERGDYTFRVEDFIIEPGVPEDLRRLKKAGFLLVVITNQGGIARGLYQKSDMQACHDYLQKECKGILDAFYYCPYHPDVTQSLSRKPDSLMMERAIAKFEIDIASSWMVGDSDRDILAAEKLGISALRVRKPWEEKGSSLEGLKAAVPIILNKK